MKMIAVIPAWNEGSRIGATVLGVKHHVDQIVVVDDGSGDGTAEAAQKAGAIVLRHRLNRGQGAALKTGTEAALRLNADVIVHVDADGQHDPNDIDALVEPIKNGRAEIVFGSRFLGVDPTGMPWIRRVYFIAARLFNTFVLGIPRNVTDPQSGARALSRKAAERINFHQDGAAHCSEILRLATHSGLAWAEVPIHVRYTAETLKKGQKFTDAFRIVWQLVIRGLNK
jgi:glycosyltransferase involved in cell wall biosynthesis